MQEKGITASTRKLIQKRLAYLAIFIILGAFIVYEEPTIEIAWVTVILLLTIYLFAFEIVAVDIAAISIMVLLGLTSLFAPFMGLDAGLVDPDYLFDGFSSNAVISIVAVMIIGAGLDKTGLMSKVAMLILKFGGASEKRIIPIISGSVGVISSFMQNVGAAALFLPVVSRISSRTKIPMSRLLMPMGFCAILGGTITMVGSSPLILLNDLILTSNTSLPSDNQMETWDLFSTTPVGIALILSGILYFIFFGKYVLPNIKNNNDLLEVDSDAYFKDVYGVNYNIYEVVIPNGSQLIGKVLDDFEDKYEVRVVATKSSKNSTRIGRGALDRETGLEARMVLGVVAEPKNLDRFVEDFNLRKRSFLISFAEDLASSKAGFAEIVIPPRSTFISQSARDIWLRKTFGVSMIALHRDGKTIREVEDIRSLPLHSGDTIVVFTTWDNLAGLERNKNFVIITDNYPHEDLRPHKVFWASFFFLVALSLILFSDVKLSIALLTGAIGMILSGVLKINEAYDAISWKTVFLLASLIPLGMAVEQSGTAKWIAEQTIIAIGDMPIWVIQASLAVLATFFTLVMSNVGATVLLVPIAVNIAIEVGADPALFALTVAIATSNSFLIPTHQVNALIMGPGGYKVADFMRAGGVMTILFIIVSIGMLNIFY